MAGGITGLHHVTAITADAQANIDFYTGALGLRMIKLTVNFDDPASYHLYYGDELGRPGSAMTFFAWPGATGGKAGPPQATVTAFSVPRGSIGFWCERLAEAGADLGDRFTRFGNETVALKDPDGMGLELVASDDSREAWRSGPVGPEQAIRGFHSVTLAEEGYERTAELLTGTMGFRKTGEDGNRFRYAAGEGKGSGAAGSVVDLVCVPDSPRGRLGAGTVHHVAFRVPNDESHRAWHSRLVTERHNVSPVIDRMYFHSIYFREPGGVLFEIATDGPGFTLDEAADKLGSALRLPPQYEPVRARIEAALPRVKLPSGRVEGNASRGRP